MNASIPEINELHALVQGPDIRVTRYPGCIVNGVKFLTKDRDMRRKGQNSGVRVEGEYNGQSADYFGVLTEIVQLKYRGNKHVVLFKCEWFDSRCFRRDNFFTSVNIKKKWYSDDPYILGIQASQVFYVPDTQLRADWHIVQSVEHRHIWDSSFCASSSKEDGSDNNQEEGDVYQQNECPIEVGDIEELEAHQLNREDDDPEIIEIQGGTSSRFIPVNGDDDFLDDEHLEDIWEIEAINDTDEECGYTLDTNEDDDL